MVTFIPGRFTDPIWQPIDLGHGASIEIAIKRPTLSEQISALAEVAGQSVTALRLNASIVDWRGVQDVNGNAVPYSWTSLGELCRAYPNAIWSLLDAVRVATSDTQESDLKNLPSPSAAGGTATTTETISSTPLSNSPVTCEGSSDYERHSD